MTLPLSSSQQFRRDRPDLRSGRRSLGSGRTKRYRSSAQAGPDYAVQGEYTGQLGEAASLQKVGMQVVALGHGAFEARLYTGGLPGCGMESRDRVETAQGKTVVDNATVISNDKWTAKIVMARPRLRCTTPRQLTKVERKSPTLGAKPPADAVVLFDGSSADGWIHGKLVQGDLLNWGVTSKQSFKDYSSPHRSRCAPKPGRGQAQQQRRIQSEPLRDSGARLVRFGRTR